MIYLIQEERTVFMMGVTTKLKVKGYYQCDNEKEVKEFCSDKTKEIKGSYDEDRMCKTYIYKELSKLN